MIKEFEFIKLYLTKEKDWYTIYYEDSNNSLENANTFVKTTNEIESFIRNHIWECWELYEIMEYIEDYFDSQYWFSVEACNQFIKDLFESDNN